MENIKLFSVLHSIDKSLKSIAKSNKQLANFWSGVYTTNDGRLGLLDLSTFKIEKMIRQSLKNSSVQTQKIAIKQKKQEVEQSVQQPKLTN